MEFFIKTPKGIVPERNSYNPKIVHNESIFFPDAVLDNEERCVQIIDEGGETIIEVIDGDAFEGRESSLNFPGETFEFNLQDENYEGFDRVVRITHTEESPARVEVDALLNFEISPN